MQKTVNPEAKEVVDTFDYVWQFILTIWNAFPDELKAYVLTMFTVSMILQWIKKALLRNMPKQKRIGWIWVAGMPLGIMLALVGWLISGEVIHEGYWLLIGLTVGTVSMGVHKVTVDFIWPFILQLKNLRLTVKVDRND